METAYEDYESARPRITSRERVRADPVAVLSDIPLQRVSADPIPAPDLASKLAHDAQDDSQAVSRTERIEGF